MSSAIPAMPTHEPDALNFFRDSGFTGGLPANLGGISMSALVISTGTGFKSLACASSPSRCASSGIDPPPQNGSYTGGGFPSVDLRISARAACSTRSLFEFSHFTNSSMRRKSRCRSASCASSVGNCSGWAEGSSTNDANNTARHAAKGRRAHHRCSVDGCPWRMDFSRAAATLMASSGRASSMSFFLEVVIPLPSASEGCRLQLVVACPNRQRTSVKSGTFSLYTPTRALDYLVGCRNLSPSFFFVCLCLLTLFLDSLDQFSRPCPYVWIRILQPALSFIQFGAKPGRFRSNPSTGEKGRSKVRAHIFTITPSNEEGTSRISKRLSANGHGMQDDGQAVCHILFDPCDQ